MNKAEVLKYLLILLWVLLAVWSAIIYRRLKRNWYPDPPESDCLYESRGYEKCPCFECYERRG